MGVSELQFPGPRRKADREKAFGQRPGWSNCFTAGTEAGPVLITPINGFVMANRTHSILVRESPFKGNLKRKLRISSSVGKRGLGLSRCGCWGLSWSVWGGRILSQEQVSGDLAGQNLKSSDAHKNRWC